MTIQDARQRLGKSESTIRRWIREGKLTATKVGGVWDIGDAAVDALSNDRSPARVDQEPEGAVLTQLREENQYLKERIQQLEHARERSDTLMLQLTRQLEQSQRLLDGHREPFWRRWFAKKA